VANYALLYVTSILLARTLSVPDFDDYNVAVSSVLVLTSLATLGLEKYALRCLRPGKIIRTGRGREASSGLPAS
jgi:hypothetical protein